MQREEEAYNRGYKIGRVLEVLKEDGIDDAMGKEKLILWIYELGLSVPKIAEETDFSIEKVVKIIEKKLK